MEIQELTQLRNKLPHRYAKLISKDLEGISDAQVRGVMGGKITDPDITEKVLAEAKKLMKRMQSMESDLKEMVSD